MPRFSADSDIVIINEGDERGAVFGSRGRGRSRPNAKRRVTIELDTQPLLFDLDGFYMGEAAAEAITERLRKSIKNISAPASPATMERRRRAERYLSGNKSPQQQARTKYKRAYEKRYSGGRTGKMDPNQTVRLFNDSMRFAEKLFTRQNPTDNTFTVNAPANRLDPSTFQGDRFQWMLNLLRQYVPEIGNVQELLRSPEVRAALDKGAQELIQRAENALDAKRLIQLNKARKVAMMAALRALREFAPI